MRMFAQSYYYAYYISYITASKYTCRYGLFSSLGQNCDAGCEITYVFYDFVMFRIYKINVLHQSYTYETYVSNHISGSLFTNKHDIAI